MWIQESGLKLDVGRIVEAVQRGTGGEALAGDLDLPASAVDPGPVDGLIGSDPAHADRVAQRVAIGTRRKPVGTS
jgi:hypothetical protein